ELAVTLLRVRAGSRGRSMPATSLAKWKTAVQMLAILLYILPLRPSADPVRLGVLIAAVVLTLWSGLAYFTAVDGKPTEGATR
ncbi:MAG TPA: CDP-alcohol phosphatidyltransferase family protein, partial [Actinomycetota bacterium]|nr:CDP-alcohol phosphatidyltransferase family protein [Actinomycetota bacterium]